MRPAVLVVLTFLLLIGCGAEPYEPRLLDTPEPTVPSPTPQPSPTVAPTPDSRACIGVWPAGAPVPGPELLPPTIEERVSGIREVAVGKLDSVDYSLPSPTYNNRATLGRIGLKVNVVENLKGGERRVHPFVSGAMQVGYDCPYTEDDQRDLAKLGHLSARLETSLADKTLIVLEPDGGGFYLSRYVASFRHSRMWQHLYRSSLMLTEVEGVGTDSDPHFDLIWEGSSQGTISLSELRTRIQRVVAEEKEKGFECVSASYEYQWYVRSGEEHWYRGMLTEDGTPIECLAARP